MMQAPSQPLGAMLDSRQKLVLLFSIALCAFTTSLSNTVTITATPKVLADLGGFSLLPWVLTSYALASTVVAGVPLGHNDTDQPRTRRSTARIGRSSSRERRLAA